MNRDEFIEWMLTCGKSIAANRYAQSIDAVSSEKGERNTNVWPGIYEYLIGKKPVKSVWATDNLIDFNRVYGQFMLMIDAKEPDDSLFDRQKYAECFTYTHSAETGTDHYRLANALKQYRLFLSWKDLLKKGICFDNTSPIAVSEFDSRQRIVYGAPGTGKSWRIKNDTQGMNVIRTTFHPDSDYSTFVGAYKPSMESFPRTFMKGEEITRVAKGDSNLLEEKRIVYRFVAQAFLEAYVAAWRKCPAYLAALATKDEPAANAATQFLVIEEINRGNCAQIFGDIFQLLDREDDGYSSYAIVADRDLRQFLCDSFKGDTDNKIPALNLSAVNLGERNVTADEITSGTNLLLPPNLYIWATMNTSDQSLFPIDSAFKRRWEWKYMPICNAGKGWKIEVAKGEVYDWWAFLEKVNALVQNATDSEDKNLGYFFCKADASGNIALEQFVGKVVFYLWNDVFKDTGFEDDAFNDGKGGRLSFNRFFDDNGNPNDDAVRLLMKNLSVSPLGAETRRDETHT